MHNVQKDNLYVLQLFTDYGRLALGQIDEKPFQKLVFLIRYWSYPYEYDYGLSGGQKYLENKLAISEDQAKELQLVRKHLNACFSIMDYFLMPHPGLEVATPNNFKS